MGSNRTQIFYLLMGLSLEIPVHGSGEETPEAIAVGLALMEIRDTQIERLKAQLARLAKAVIDDDKHGAEILAQNVISGHE